MSSKDHKKHTALIRPELGNFGRNEWAIMGAPCNDIKLLAENVIAALSPVAKIAYADMQHNDEPEATPARFAAGAVAYTAKPGQQQFNYNGELNNFQTRPLFNICDMILLNGNHHPAQKQVVVIDSKKKASLQKRIGQLTDVRLFLLADGAAGIFDFLKAAIPNWQQIPVCRLGDTDKITAFFKDQLVKPALNGLVLSGGKSQRMGRDKGSINWHQQEQRYYMADMLKNYAGEVYISCRADQQQEIDPAYPTIADTFTGLGPFGAILSAFREQPEKAWLVAACDLPLLDAATLTYLMANRNASAIATAFANEHDGFPEPLITIWEPKSYPVLLSFLAQGYSCPRKVLINSDSKIIQAPQPAALTNVNTPQELEKAKALLQQQIVNS